MSEMDYRNVPRSTDDEDVEGHRHLAGVQHESASDNKLDMKKLAIDDDDVEGHAARCKLLAALHVANVHKPTPSPTGSDP